jgi:hypothetical protein
MKTCASLHSDVADRQTCQRQAEQAPDTRPTTYYQRLADGSARVTQLQELALIASGKRSPSAIRLSASSPEAAKNSALPPESVSAATIQRKVGFEFETANLVTNAEPKERVGEGHGFHIDADTAKGGGHCIEFVIDPAETLEQAQEYIGEAVTMAESLRPNSKLGNGKVSDKQFDADWRATAQHTEGVSMEQMAHFLETNLEDSTGHAGMYGQFKSRLRVSGRERAPEEGMSQLVAWYAYALKHWETNADTTDGPKNAMGIMSRTDFYSMYAYIKSIGREQAYEDAQNRALAALGIDRKDPLIPSRYKSSDDHGEEIENPMTVGEWLDSFTQGFERVVLDSEGRETDKSEHRNKDELSPPFGFRYLEPEYSMGAMGMDGNLALIESRSRNGMEELAKAEWSDYADQVFGEIEDRNMVEEENPVEAENPVEDGVSDTLWDEA